MGTRAKVRRSTSRRGTVAVSRRVMRPSRPARHSKPAKSARAHETKSHPHNGISNYSKALRFLSSLLDFERLRIVRYNNQNFDLDRMRTLLRRMGNPQEHFRSVHIAGTKGKG